MSVAPQRTLHVRCATWDQVSVFTSRKLRRGKLLSMKVPFAADVGAAVTLGLELPNGLVIAIDGNVKKASPIVGEATGKTWIEVELQGFTDEVMTRIRGMAQTHPDERKPEPPPPVAPRRTSTSVAPESLPADERELFQHLAAELRRLRQLSVHEVLGVAPDAGPTEIRDGWMDLVRRNHPDLVARRNAPAITHLAEELTILVNRAYDRLRSSLVADGKAAAAGPRIAMPPGWLVGFEDLGSDGNTPPPPTQGTPGPRGPKHATIPPIVQAAAASTHVQGGEAFEMRARTMLGQGDAETAREVLAAALCVYPRSKPLRSLYFVASALGALQQGELMLAMSQLETALAHHEQCVEASAMLEHMRKHGQSDLEALKRLFK